MFAWLGRLLVVIDPASDLLPFPNTFSHRAARKALIWNQKA